MGQSEALVPQSTKDVPQNHCKPVFCGKTVLRERRFNYNVGLSERAAQIASVAELVDALDLGSSGATRGSSTLPSRTKYQACAVASVVCIRRRMQSVLWLCDNRGDARS